MENAVEDSSQETAKRIEKEAKRNCPVLPQDKQRAAKGKSWTGRTSGKLRDAIKAAPSKYDDKNWIVFVPGQGSDTYYARWVELGAPARKTEQWHTAGHEYPVPRQPFLRPALMKEKAKFKSRLRQTIFTRVTREW